MGYSIHLGKENFKFSSSHFTILSKDHAERLHGHNYQAAVHLKVEELDPNLGFAFDFNLVKPQIKIICDSLDEYILLPSQSPYLKIEFKGTQVNVRFLKKEYSFPQTDVVTLPLKNISAEELAKYFGKQLSEQIASVPGWTEMEVFIEETRGQSVSYSLKRP